MSSTCTWFTMCSQGENPLQFIPAYVAQDNKHYFLLRVNKLSIIIIKSNFAVIPVGQLISVPVILFPTKCKIPCRASY